MAVSPHPSVRPAEPRKPPEDRSGQGARESGIRGERYGASRKMEVTERSPGFGGYEHSGEHTDGHYGHDRHLKVHGHGDHKSEFADTVEGGARGGFPKAGDKDDR